jgi:hypothetical protein
LQDALAEIKTDYFCNYIQQQCIKSLGIYFTGLASENLWREEHEREEIIVAQWNHVTTLISQSADILLPFTLPSPHSFCSFRTVVVQYALAIKSIGQPLIESSYTA